MPRKFGDNHRAVAARARREEVKVAAATRKHQEQEDASWADNDKHVQRREQRKTDRERKHQEQTDRRKEAQKLLEDEEAKFPSKGVQPSGQSKVTRGQIHDGLQLEKEREQLARREAKEPAKVQHPQPLEENVNRVLDPEAVVARSVDDAIAALRVEEPDVDRHPERRVKAAYVEFEAARLAELRADNPTLRLSQLRQQLRREWRLSPDNPMNKAHVNYNA
uniref:coiled-coil domain-containing protein 124 n=1 Tax=Myxine glutinosa TaxID=7769 RepID=UPI0035901C50